MSPDGLESEVIVLGGGPAGYAAAIYLARADLRPIVIEGAEAGGALMSTSSVANYPGFADGINGPDLMEAMRRQAANFGAVFIEADATAVDLGGSVKTITTEDRVLRSRAVVLATGSRWRRMGVPGEEDFVGRGVGSCATCDGAYFRDQDVAVVGGGDSALEEATFLTRYARSVTLVHRRDTLRASTAMQKQAAADAKIAVLWNHETVSVIGNDTVTALRVRHTSTSREQLLPVTGVFVAIGHDPASDLFRDQVAVDERGYVQTAARSTRTNVEGVFAAGDLADPIYRQAITSAGTGAAAALDVEHWLAALTTRKALIVNKNRRIDVPHPARRSTGAATARIHLPVAGSIGPRLYRTGGMAGTRPAPGDLTRAHHELRGGVRGPERPVRRRGRRRADRDRARRRPHRPGPDTVPTDKPLRPAG